MKLFKRTKNLEQNLNIKFGKAVLSTAFVSTKKVWSLVVLSFMFEFLFFIFKLECALSLIVKILSSVKILALN